MKTLKVEYFKDEIELARFVNDRQLTHTDIQIIMYRTSSGGGYYFPVTLLYWSVN